jgi:hypothetical protein
MSQVFVLDTNKQALNPMHPGRARLLLTAGKAALYRRYPFTIILKRATREPMLHPLRVKIDPGSKTTGIAVVNDASGEVMWAAELTHRGGHIKRALDQRRTVRRNRRQRKTRYRKPRFDNRRKRKGTLAPSLQSRVCTIITWVRRLIGLCPITAISQELVRVDTQVMENPDIEGVAYQQGELAGYEIREYVLVKWNHTCAYCDAQNVPLQLDHVQARSRNGSNRVKRGLAKTHWLDAACVGASTPHYLRIKGIVPLLITATGHGNRRMCRMDRFGFPRTGPKLHKRVQGFQTGDLARAVVSSGSKQGTYAGKVAVRRSGSFNITTTSGTVQGIHARYCVLVARSDGYTYQTRKECLLPPSA